MRLVSRWSARLDLFVADYKRPALVAKALACWNAADEADKNQLAREKEDMGFYAGGERQWPEAAVKARQGMPADVSRGIPEVHPRPMLSINKTRAPVRQLLNQERNAHIGAELIPADDFGTGVPDDVKAEIELREGLYRRIQRQSDAMAAHSWAFDRVAQAGRGFWRVNVEPVSDRSFDLEIRIGRIFNQSSVRLDPSHVEPDGSDTDWAIIAVDMSGESYTVAHPDSDVAQAVSADGFTGLMSEAPGWFSDVEGQKTIRVVEYFYKVYEKKVLCWFNEQPMWADMLPEGVEAVGPPDPTTGQPTKPRDVQVPTVKWAKLNGCEVLDEQDWAGKYIPIIKELGEELQPFDNDRRAEGVVRQAISSQQGFNFMASELVYAIGMATKAPLMATQEQISGYEGFYERAATMPMPYLLYNPISEAGTLLPPPMPTDRNVPIQHIAFGLNTFAQGIHDTTGVPEASLGNVDPSLKSGRAILALQKQAQQATSNFLDNHARSIRYEARIVNDLLMSVYNNRPGRLVQILNGSNETETWAIGGQASGAEKVATLTDREFAIAVKVGKNYDTRAEEGAAALAETLGANPGILAAYLDLWFKLQTWPGAKEAEERAKLMLPPNIQQAEAQKNKNPQAELQQVKGQLEQTSKLTEALTQRVKEQQIQIETDTVKQAGETTRLQMELASKERIAAMQEHAALIATESKINAAHASEMLKGEIARVLAGLEDQHELLRDAIGHKQTLEQGGIAHEQGLEAGDVAHQQGLEAQEQQAAMMPEPAE
jgi:hypothetical protein